MEYYDSLGIAENPFYCHYNDECWIKLAQSIIEETAKSYANQFPKFCRTQAEFDMLDKKSFAPIRKGILTKLFNGPVRVMVDKQTYIDAFERKRREAMHDFEIQNLK